MHVTHPIGIDLGTTNSAVARLSVTGHTEMVPNGWGEFLTPSIVLFEDDTIVVGREAQRARAFALERVASQAKREMGAALYSRPLRGRQLPPEVLQAYILRQLRQDVENHVSGAWEAVITVPAFFDERRRQKTRDAAEMAGIRTLDIVNEPTAAALAFGEQMGFIARDRAPEHALTLLVYDLGGGTFDVTVIELGRQEVRTLATDGDVHLGGYDWDRRLRDYVSQKFEDRFRSDPRSDPQAKTRLLQACEEAKKTLTARRQTTIAADFQGHHVDVTVAREVFEELTADLVERTMHTTRQVLRAAARSWEQVDRILLVGGSTRMPMIADRLRRESGIEPDTSINPDEAVARGAAIFAADRLLKKGQPAPKLKVQVIDVNSHSLGIEGINQTTDRKQNIILIPKNSPLPIGVRQTFVTKRDNQQSVVIRVLEGEGSDVNACIPVGKAVMRHLPEGLPKGHPIEVAYHYGTNGQLDVRAKLVGTQHELNVQFERDGSLGDRRVRQWRKILEQAQGYSRLDQMLEQLFGTHAEGETAMTDDGDSDVIIDYRGH